MHFGARYVSLVSDSQQQSGDGIEEWTVVTYRSRVSSEVRRLVPYHDVHFGHTEYVLWPIRRTEHIKGKDYALNRTGIGRRPRVVQEPGHEAGVQI